MKNTEETRPLNANSHQTEMVHYGIQMIDRIGSSDNAVLPVATLDRSNGRIQVFLTNSAFQAFTNAPNQRTPDNVSRINELNELFSQKSNLFHSQEGVMDDDDDDYIEWSLAGDNLIKKRKEFREQLDLYKTYDGQHQSIRRLLIEIIDYYLKEYLVQEECFSIDEITKLERYFQEAINENNYLKYFIQVYTSNEKFHRALNKHLALYILDYFDLYLYSSIPRGYRLINCLVYMVTLLIHHPDIHKYRYKGTAYRYLWMTEDTLEQYTIGNHILNRSFISSKKTRAIADDDQQNVSRKIPVLLKYTIVQDQTAIDIAHLSTIPDTDEILIMPFSVFQVKNRTQRCSNRSSSIFIEIELEECEEDEGKLTQEIDRRSHEMYLADLDEPVPTSEHQIKKNQRFTQSKHFYGCIGACIILALIVIGSANVKLLNDLDAKLLNVEQKKSNQSYEHSLGKHGILDSCIFLHFF